MNIKWEHSGHVPGKCFSKSISDALKMQITGFPPPVVNLNLWGNLKCAFLSKCATESSASKNSAWEQCQIFSWNRTKMWYKICVVATCVLVPESTKRRFIFTTIWLMHYSQSEFKFTFSQVANYLLLYKYTQDQIPDGYFKLTFVWLDL